MKPINNKGDFSMTENKLYAVALMGIGALTMLVSKDATFLVFTMLLGIPMFISKRSWFD